MQFLPSTMIVALSDPLLGLAGWISGALGYVGPGAGLSMLGALFAVACVVLIALLAPILYPIRWLRSVLRRRRAQPNAGLGAAGEDAAVTVDPAVADSYPGPPTTLEPVLAGSGVGPPPSSPASGSNQLARSEHQ